MYELIAWDLVKQQQDETCGPRNARSWCARHGPAETR